MVQMKHRGLLIAAALAGCAHQVVAQPGPVAQPAAKACSEAGDALYRIDEDPVIDTRKVRVRTQVFASGAWTVEDPSGVHRGCLAADRVDAIKAALDRATFMRVVTNAQCNNPHRLVYFVDGNNVYEQYGCAFDFDEPTQQAVDEIAAILRSADVRR